MLEFVYVLERKEKGKELIIKSSATFELAELFCVLCFDTFIVCIWDCGEREDSCRKCGLDETSPKRLNAYGKCSNGSPW
jgi:hypothetical protein